VRAEPAGTDRAAEALDRCRSGLAAGVSGAEVKA
jgi:hypothetical protein